MTSAPQAPVVTRGQPGVHGPRAMRAPLCRVPYGLWSYVGILGHPLMPKRLLQDDLLIGPVGYVSHSNGEPEGVYFYRYLHPASAGML